MTDTPSPNRLGAWMPEPHRWRSWCASVVLHGLLALLLGWAYRNAPAGAATEAVGQVGIVLKQVSDDGETTFVDEDSAPANFSDPDPTAATSPSLPTPADSMPAETPGGSPGDALPNEAAVIGAGAPSRGTGEGTGDLLSGGAPRRNPAGGKAKTAVFGVQGEGYRFCYVFDRSGSMQGSGGSRSPLAAAKAQLLESIDSLADSHQFQIVFYNQDPYLFNPAGQARLAFATDRIKELARRFIGSVSADGGTNHERALRKALELGPDVIFFLTDAGDGMSPGKLAEIRRINGGRSSINVIEFGIGPPEGASNFLKQLAAENGGKYAYVDVTGFQARP